MQEALGGPGTAIVEPQSKAEDGFNRSPRTEACSKARSSLGSMKPISRATCRRIRFLMHLLGHREAARLLKMRLDYLYELLRGVQLPAGVRDGIAKRLDNLERKDTE